MLFSFFFLRHVQTIEKNEIRIHLNGITTLGKAENRPLLPDWRFKDIESRKFYTAGYS